MRNKVLLLLRGKKKIMVQDGFDKCPAGCKAEVRIDKESSYLGSSPAGLE